MLSEKALTYLEKNAVSHPNDYGLRIMLANVCFAKNETEKALSQLRSIRHDTPNSDYGEYAAYTLNLYNFFSDANRPFMQYRSYEEIAEAIFEKKNRHNWDDNYIIEYLDFIRSNSSMKWAPFAMIEVLEFFFLNDEFESAKTAAAAINENYPQSFWDARARLRMLDIEHNEAVKKIRRLKELVTLMEYKKKSGVLQDQGQVAEKLALEADIQKAVPQFSENVIHLAQRYKNYKFVRNEFFKIVSMHEEKNDGREIIKTLSNINNIFNEFPEGVKAHFDLGMYYFKTANYQMALQFFNEHLSHYPKSPATAQATFMTGKIFQMQNRISEAMSFFKKTLQMNDETWANEASGSAIEICKQLYSEKKYDQTIEIVGDMRSAKFSEISMAEAAFVEGNCHRDLSLSARGNAAAEHLQKAVDIFNHLTERYPETVFSPMARAALHEIQNGSLKTSIIINRISNFIIMSLFIGYFVLLGYSMTQSNNGFYFLIMVVQIALLLVGLIVMTSFNVLGRLWDMIFG